MSDRDSLLKELVLRENAVTLAAEFLHEFLCRKANVPPFFDDLTSEARRGYFREAADFVDRVTDLIGHKPDQVGEPG